MSIDWRTTLVQMQGALAAAGSAALPLSASTEGYALLRQLTLRGTAYDSTADDGVNNASAFAATVNAYVSQAEPTFLECDRFCRYIFSEYLVSPLMTPACALAFGVLTQAQAASWQSYIDTMSAYEAALATWTAAGSVGTAPVFSPPSGATVPQLNPAEALGFDRNFVGALSTKLQDRNYQAGLLAVGTPDAVNLTSAANAWFSGVWYDTDETSHANTSPPTNPSVTGESASSLVTTKLTTTVANCQSWLAATAFQ